MHYLKIVIGVASTAFFGVMFVGAFNAGIDHEKAAQQKIIDKKRAEMYDEFSTELSDAVTSSEKWRQVAIDTQAKLKIKPKTVTEYVTKIEKSSNCDYLGPNFVHMHNHVAGQFNGRIENP